MPAFQMGAVLSALRFLCYLGPSFRANVWKVHHMTSKAAGKKLAVQSERV